MPKGMHKKAYMGKPGKSGARYSGALKGSKKLGYAGALKSKKR